MCYDSGAQKLSGRVLNFRLRGHRFESRRRHCVVLVKILDPQLIQPRKPTDMTEKLLTGK